MAIVPKNKVLQVRVHEVQLKQFERVCSYLGVRPTVRIRELMNADFVRYQSKLALASKTASEPSSEPAATSVLVQPQNEPVRPPVKSGGLSERLKAEREAKKLKKKKREDKWLYD